MDKNKLNIKKHVRILCASYQHWTGKELLQGINSDFSEALQQAQFAVLSHGTETDPILNYANALGLRLFEYELPELVRLPSRLTAEPINQEARAKLLQRVSDNGFIDDYAGIRIAKSGQRFWIRNTTVWNLLDEQGQHYGQAALIRDYELID